MKAKKFFLVAVLVVMVVSCAGCAIGKSEENSEEAAEPEYEKVLMQRLAKGEKEARTDIKQVEDQKEKLRDSLLYIIDNLEKVKNEKTGLNIMEKSSYLSNLATIRQDELTGKESATDDEKSKAEEIAKHQITKVVKEIYDYMLLSGDEQTEKRLKEIEEDFQVITDKDVEKSIKEWTNVLK